MSHFVFVFVAGRAQVQNEILSNYIIAEIFSDLSTESLFILQET